MPYIHFTEAQKLQANAVDLVEFLRFKGEPPRPLRAGVPHGQQPQRHRPGQ